MEQLEVMPVSTRVACLNAPHLKSLCVFEALSRTLGCYYNHHRSQVVSCQGVVRLPAPKIIRIRGHATHIPPLGETPTLTTTLQMGTYLVFYLAEWKQVQQCQLILNGVEKVPRTHVPPQVLLQRIHHSCPTTGLPAQPDNQQPDPPDSSTYQILPLAPSPTHEAPHHHKPSLGPPTFPKPMRKPQPASSSPDLTPQPYTHLDNRTITDSYNHKNQWNEKHVRHSDSTSCLILNMEKTEEVTTLLDEEEDCSSDASDDLHKVVRRRLSVDVTPLLQPPPTDQLLVLLLRPGEETQAWQFLSACLQVSHCSGASEVRDGSSTLKKTLTRTKPLYFSRNGNAHRI